MNSEQMLNLMMDSMEPDLLEASGNMAIRCQSITDLFIDKAKVDPIAATWMTAIALEHYYQFLKTHPDAVNKYINDYKDINNG